MSNSLKRIGGSKSTSFQKAQILPSFQMAGVANKKFEHLKM
jgi:hypothetical protein